jgi:hypothetical protein
MAYPGRPHSFLTFHVTTRLSLHLSASPNLMGGDGVPDAKSNLIDLPRHDVAHA